MKKNVRSASFRHLHKLLDTKDQSLVDGVILASFDHPVFGAATIVGWERAPITKTVRLKVKVGQKSIHLSSKFLLDRDVPVTLSNSNPTSKALAEKCLRLELEEQLQAIRVKSDQISREAAVEEAHHRNEIVRLQNLLQSRDSQRSIVQTEIQSSSKPDVISGEEQDRVRNAYALYKSSVEEISQEYRGVILQELHSILPEEYVLSAKSIARLAIDRYGAKLPEAIASAYPMIEIDPFVATAITFGGSGKPWDKIDLIKHFCDSGYFLSALKLLFRMEKEALDTEYLDAIRNQQLKLLSACGLSAEADMLARRRLGELESNEYFAFTIWGLYHRWPELDPDGQIKSRLVAIFEKIGKSPENVKEKRRAKISDKTREQIREVVGSHLS